MHHAFLYISLPSLQDYDVKMPKFTFSAGERERKTMTFSFFPDVRYSLLEFSSGKKNANIWRIERDGISAIKFEAGRIKFLSDVFVAVAVVAA